MTQDETETDTSGLEVEVWLRCPDTATLWEFAQTLAPPVDGSERIPPPEGRKSIVMTWKHPRTGGDDPWADAFSYGASQGQSRVDEAQEQGIEAAVYAVRVQWLDAEFHETSPATKRVVSGG